MDDLSAIHLSAWLLVVPFLISVHCTSRAHGEHSGGIRTQFAISNMYLLVADTMTDLAAAVAWHLGRFVCAHDVLPKGQPYTLKCLYMVRVAIFHTTSSNTAPNGRVTVKRLVETERNQSPSSSQYIRNHL
jgi:hypothetical protein